MTMTRVLLENADAVIGEEAVKRLGHGLFNRGGHATLEIRDEEGGIARRGLGKEGWKGERVVDVGLWLVGSMKICEGCSGGMDLCAG
jgi:hypothetical protein